jgi:heme-degrading monooxygenase HmoA
MPDTAPVTFINVFEIPLEQLDSFLVNWSERAEFMSKQPGLRSFRLHRALSPDSRFQLVNVAEWDSVEALQAATANPDFQASIQSDAEAFDVKAYPGVFHVAYEFTGSAG